MRQAALTIDEVKEGSESMKIGSICNENVETVCAAAKLADAAQILAEKRVEVLVVIASAVQRPTAIGIITDRDILRAALEHPEHFKDLRVIDILSRTPLVLNQDEDVDSAIRKLAAANERFAPVIGTGGTLRGAISHQDLLSYSDGAPVPAHSEGPQTRR